MSSQHQVLFTQLRDHLEAELHLHRRLLTLAERKQALIVAGNIPAFTGLLQEEQPAISEAGRLRLFRERLLRAAATVLGIAGDDLRLGTILDKLAEPLRHELHRRQQDLKSLLERLRQVNDRNLLLIRHGLAYATDLITAVLGERVPTTGAYDRRGLGGHVPASGRGRLLNLAG